MKTLSTRQIARKFNKNESDVVSDFEDMISHMIPNHVELGYRYTKSQEGYILSKDPSLDLIRKYTKEILKSAEVYFSEGDDERTITQVETDFSMEKGSLFKWLEQHNWLTKLDDNKMRSIGSAIKGFDLMKEKDFIDSRTGKHRRLVVFTPKGLEVLKKKNEYLSKFPFSRICDRT